MEQRKRHLNSRAIFVRPVLAVGCSAVALAASGCGSGSGSSPGTSGTALSPTSSTGSGSAQASPLSKSAYLQKLKLVVRPWQAAAQRFQSDYGQALSNADLAGAIQAIKAFTDANDAFASSVGSLQAPAAVRPHQAKLIADLGQISAGLRQLKVAFSTQNRQLLSTVQPKLKAELVTVLSDAQAIGQAARGG